MRIFQKVSFLMIILLVKANIRHFLYMEILLRFTCSADGWLECHAQPRLL